MGGRHAPSVGGSSGLRGLAEQETESEEAVKAEKTRLGFFSVSGSALVAHALLQSGLDYVCIDLQHGVMGEDVLAELLLTVAVSSGTSFVRVREKSASAIGRALDLGASGVIVPQVEEVAEAAEAVAACRFPPRGGRSYGPLVPGILRRPTSVDALEAVECYVMIESVRGLENLGAILDVAGLSGIYIGPWDLSVDLGCVPGDFEDVRLSKALLEILAGCRSRGVSCGIQCADFGRVAWALEAGFDVVTIGTDIGLLADYVGENLAMLQASGG